MESLELCCVAPHPPILIPEIAGSDIKHIQKSTQAITDLGGEIKNISPETLVVMSPHTPIYGDAFSVMVGKSLSGSFSQFRAPRVTFQSTPDMELAEVLMASADKRKIPLVASRGGSAWSGGEELDHGILVPLYYLAPDSCQLVCLSISLLDYYTHYRLGLAIREAVEEVGRKVVFIGSGDLSHRLTPGAPAGYSPRGEEFDKVIVDIMDSGDYEALFDLDPRLVDDAGECGLRSIFTLAGIVDGYDVDSKVMSYEGPFGVGYMVARVVPGEQNPSRVIPPP